MSGDDNNSMIMSIKNIKEWKRIVLGKREKKYRQ